MTDEELEFVEVDDPTLPDGEEPPAVTEPRPPVPPAAPEMSEDELEAAAQQFLATKGYQVSKANQDAGDEDSDDWEARIKREAVEAARKTVMADVRAEMIQGNAATNRDAILKQAANANLTDDESSELRAYLETLDPKALYDMATQSQGVNLGWMIVGKRTADERKVGTAQKSSPAGSSAESHGTPPQKRTVTLNAEQNKRWESLVNVYCGGDKSKASARMREAFLEAEGIR